MMANVNKAVPLDIPESHMNELGDSGLRRYGGYVRDEFLTQLTGRRGMRVYREMRDNNPVIGGIMFLVEQMLRNVQWKVEPASDSARANNVANFVQECMTDMDRSWNDVTDEQLTFLTFGFAVQEVTFKYRNGIGSKHDDGRIGWKSINMRAQETIEQWEFTDHGAPIMAYQRPFTGRGMRKISLSKCLHIRTTKRKNNPEGRSILRNAYEPWYYQKHISSIEAIGIERDLAGMPIMRVPIEIMREDAEDDSKALYESLKRILRNVKRNVDEGLILPSDADEKGNKLYDFDLVSSSGNRQFNSNEIITRYDQRISQSMVADFILLGHEKVGSFALSSDKTDMFGIAFGAFLAILKEVANNQAIPMLMQVNNIKPNLWPTLVHTDIEKVAIKEFANGVKALTAAGLMTPTSETENEARGLIGLTSKVSDEQFDEGQERREAASNSDISQLMSDDKKDENDKGDE